MQLLETKLIAPVKARVLLPGHSAAQGGIFNPNLNSGGAA